MYFLLLSSFVLAYEETLKIQPLNDGHLMASFKFTQEYQQSDQEGFRYFGDFPGSIVDLVDEAGVVDLELGMTVGRWQFGEWGMPEFPLTPTGLFISAWIDGEWERLKQSLSGLVCASTNLASAQHIGRSASQRDGLAKQHYMVQMPREAFCTENLTPFLRLLPCESRAGLASLLNPHQVLDNRFHSINLRVQVREGKLFLTQQLSLVFNWYRWHRDNVNWTLEGLFQRIEIGDVGVCKVEPSIQLRLPKTWRASVLTAEPDETAQDGDFEVHYYSECKRFFLVDGSIGVTLPVLNEKWEIKDALKQAPVLIEREIEGKNGLF